MCAAAERTTRRALRFARRLIAFQSPSHVSNLAITRYLGRKLEKYGFVVEGLSYRDRQGVAKYNLVAKKGAGSGGLAYFCHTDTVPADEWSLAESGPFRPVVRSGRLYGRGACDMKGSIACMLSAVRATLEGSNHDDARPFYFVATADEEVGYGGARHVVQHSRLYREMVNGETCAIIGEPTSLEVVHAHKGSTLITATAYGRAAHSSTREGRNANLAMIPFLVDIKRLFDSTEQDSVWRNDDFDPPTMRWNICLSDNQPAVNVTAARCVCQIYFRPMPGLDVGPLVQQCQAIAERSGVQLEVEAFGGPMYTDPHAPFVRAALRIAGNATTHTVGYGTDGGALDEIRPKIVLGPGSIAQAHTDDEWISLDQISMGADIYCRFLREFCLHAGEGPQAASMGNPMEADP